MKTRRTLAALVSIAIAAACSSSDPGPSASPDGGGACATDEKPCNGGCVKRDDPAYGCAADSCSLCANANAPNTTTACRSGLCANECVAGFGDCDGEARNGCEVRTATDAANCGACGNTCGADHTVSKVCNGGHCSFNCEAGFSHCSSDDAKGCDVVTSTAKDDCGACGHSCLGGDCAAGVCQPFVVGPTTLNEPRAMALDKYSIYFAAADGIYRIGKDGKCSTPVCPQKLYPDAADAVTVDGARVYWLAKNGEVAQGSTMGGGAPIVLGTADAATGLAIDGTKIFYTTHDGPGTVMRAAAGTPASAVPFAGNDASHDGEQVVTNGAQLFWTDSAAGKIYARAPSFLDSCGTTCDELADTSDPSGLVLDQYGSLYVAERTAQRIRFIDTFDPSRSREIAVGLSNPRSLLVDGTYIYFASYDEHSFRRAPIPTSAATPSCTGGCELVLSGPDLRFPEAIAADASAFYFLFRESSALAAGTGRIVKRAR